MFNNRSRSVSYSLKVRDSETYEGDPSKSGNTFANNSQLIHFLAPSVLLLHVDNSHQSGLSRADDSRVLRRGSGKFGASRSELNEVLLSDETIRYLLSLQS